jgi:alpha-ketoglutarate-dependent taurine dioxygenase
VPWQAGDVALVDNYVTMHGRRTFTGPRKVLVSLVAGE